LHTLWKVYGPFWYLAVRYGALPCIAEMLRKACGPLGALRCVVVQCGNVVEGLRQWTIAEHCGAMHMLWKAYAPLWYLAVPYSALRWTAYMLRKACGPLWCLVVCYGTVRKHHRRVADHRGALWCVVYVVEGLQTVTTPCGALQCIAVHCGNVAEGLQTIAVHCGVVCTLWMAYEPLWYLSLPYAAMRGVAVH